MTYGALSIGVVLLFLGMPFRVIAAGLIAIYLRDSSLFVPAIIAAVASFWAVGVAHNFRYDPENMPTLAAAGATIAPLASLIILGVSFL